MFQTVRIYPVLQTVRNCSCFRQCQAGGSLLTVFNVDQPAEVSAAARLGTPRLHALLDRVAGRGAAAGRPDLVTRTLDQYLRLAGQLVATDLGSVKATVSEMVSPGRMQS